MEKPTYLFIIPILTLIISISPFAFEISEGGNGLPVYWNPDDLPAVYEINSYGSTDCEGTAEAIEASADTWTNVNGSFFEFVRGPDTDIMNYGQDGHSILVFYHPEYNQYGQGGLPSFDGVGTGYIAANVYWFSTDGPHYNEMYEFDIIFNGYGYDWDTSPNGTAGKMDVQNIATHELGHSLSLADLYYNDASEYTMYGYTKTGEIGKRTLMYDDEDGIRYLYGDETYNPPRPRAFEIRQNYPNPASDSTTITFYVAVGQQDDAILTVYDIKGRAIAEPFHDRVIRGIYEVEWDLRGSNGAKVAPGVYLYKLQLRDEVAVKKMVVK
jgi:hypothetical protein